MSDEVRGSDPIMTTKDAILEVRGDVKVLLAFMHQIVQADLPKRMDRVEDRQDDIEGRLDTHIEAERAWRRGLAAAGTILGAVLVVLQIVTMLR